MKKLVLSAALLITSSLAMISCNNGDYDANPDTNNSGTPPPVIGGGGGSFDWSGTDPMSAKVDGNSFQATSGSGTYFPFNGSASISAEANSRRIAIAIPENTAAGTVVNVNGMSSISITDNLTDVYSSSFGGNGSVKILENDATHIKGLFSGQCKNMSGAVKNISEGYFNITK